jgi:hypothetical protein
MSILDKLLDYDIFEGRIPTIIESVSKRRFNLIDRVQDKARQEMENFPLVIPVIKL